MFKKISKLKRLKFIIPAGSASSMTASILIGVFAILVNGVSGCARTGGYSPSTGSSDDSSTTPTDPGTPVDPPSASGPKIIFAAVQAVDGRLGATAAAAIVAADALCNSDVQISHFSSPHNTSTYKALLAAAGVRTASPALNWVLAPSKEYLRSDESTSIGTTTSDSVFTFPLTNSFVHYNGMTSDIASTGLNVDWTTASDNCSNWTNNTSGSRFAADGNATNSTAIYDSGRSLSCTDGYILFCVEQ